MGVGPGPGQALNASRQRGREARMLAAARACVPAAARAPANGAPAAAPAKTAEEQRLEDLYQMAVAQDKQWDRWTKHMTCGFSYQCCEVFSMFLGAGLLLWAVAAVYISQGFSFQHPPAPPPTPAHLTAVSWTLTAQRQQLRAVHYEHVRGVPPPDALNVEQHPHVPLPGAAADPSPAGAASAAGANAASAGAGAADPDFTYSYTRMEWHPAPPRLTATKGAAAAAALTADAPERWTGRNTRRPLYSQLRARLQGDERLVNVRFTATAHLLVGGQPPAHGGAAADDGAAAAAAAAASEVPAETTADAAAASTPGPEAVATELSVGLYGFDALYPKRVNGWVSLRGGMLDIGEDARAELDKRLTAMRSGEETDPDADMPPQIEPAVQLY